MSLDALWLWEPRELSPSQSDTLCFPGAGARAQPLTSQTSSLRVAAGLEGQSHIATSPMHPGSFSDNDNLSAFRHSMVLLPAETKAGTLRASQGEAPIKSLFLGIGNDLRDPGPQQKRGCTRPLVLKYGDQSALACLGLSLFEQ